MTKIIITHFVTWSMFLLSLVGNAHGAEACRSTFLVTGTPETHLVYAATQSVPQLDATKIMETLRQTIEKGGFKFVGPKREGHQSIMDFVSKDDGKTVEYQTRIVADESNDALTMIIALPTGNSADSLDMNNRLCNVLTVLGEANKSESSENEASGQVSSNTTLQPADDSHPSAGDRTTPPPEIKNILKPSMAFDAASTKAALEPGTATITGKACTMRGGLQLATNEKIVLFPDTPYLREYIKLARHAKPGRDRMDADPEFLAVHLEGVTNSKGEFKFSEMKAGKYYLYATMSTDVTGVQTVDRGVDASGPVIVHYYSEEPFIHHYDDKLEKFITVEDGKITKVRLSPSFGSGGNPGLFGCR